MWTYKGVGVYRAGANSSGIRWYARVPGQPSRLRADSKQSMRDLINHYLTTRS